MGIINVTPDSFSDGGKYLDADKAVAHGFEAGRAGADILDIGGQSTRPGARRTSVREELDRVMPVVSALGRISPVPISIDTFEPGVAEEALVAGVEAINDITAFADPDMLKLAVSSGCGVCAMHMQGVPQTMQVNPHYDDVIGEVLQFLASGAMPLRPPASSPPASPWIRASVSARARSIISPCCRMRGGSMPWIVPC